MTDDREIILGGRRLTDPEPDQVLVWNGDACDWMAIPNPKIVASANNIPGPGQWITTPIIWTSTLPISNPADPIIIGIDYAVEPVAKKNNKDGCHCKKCKEYFPYAEPNQDDGSLVCYACRHGL